MYCVISLRKIDNNLVMGDKTRGSDLQRGAYDSFFMRIIVF